MNSELQNIPIHFLIGIGRSGTTLLTMILNENKNIIAAPENNFLLYFLKDFRDKKFITEEEKNKFIRNFSKKYNDVTSVWKPGEKCLQEIFKNNPQGISYVDLCREIYFDYNRITDKKIKAIVDKNPFYSLHLKTLSGFLPDAKFIVLVRDYRNNVLSQRKNFTGILDVVSTYASVWKIYYEFILKFQIKNPEKILVVKYEELVANPNTIVKKICDFINVDFNEKMLDYYKNIGNLEQQAKTTLTEKEFQKIYQMHINLTRPINHSGMNKWKTEFSEKEIKIIETIAGKTAEKFGYGISYKTGRWEKTMIEISNFPFVVYTKIYLHIFSILKYDISLQWRKFIPKLRGK